MLHRLVTVIRTRTSPEGLRWLETAIAECVADPALPPLLRAYTAAPRKVGRAPLALRPEEVDAFGMPGLSFAQWTVDDAARAALLLAAGDADPERLETLAAGVYDAGDAREQQSWLRGLPLLPHPGRFAAAAIDACRTNVVPLFESIACENPFPARHFPERNFNQMVLKALFNAIALERIVDLPSRLNPELSRMANDYVTEREAAGRPVPQDIWVVLAPYADPAALPRVRRYLAHQDQAHRKWAAAGLDARERLLASQGGAG